MSPEFSTGKGQREIEDRDSPQGGWNREQQFFTQKLSLLLPTSGLTKKTVPEAIGWSQGTEDFWAVLRSGPSYTAKS